MKLFVVLALLAFTSASDVQEWTDADFDDNVRQNELVLVKFYAPWCGHCKRMVPEFDSASTILKNNDPPVVLAKVDCTADGKASCSKFGVSGYPTLKMFRGDISNVEDYNGPRESDGIVKYLRGKAGPSSKTLTTEAELLTFIGHQDHSIVGFFSDEGSDLAKKFKNLADALSEDYRFAHTTDADVMAAQGHTDTVVLFRPQRLQNKFDEAKMVYDDEATFPALKAWLQNNYHGFAGHRTTSNQAQFNRPLVAVYYDVDYVKNIKGTNYWRNRVMKVAKKLREAGKTVNFAVSGAEEFNHEMSEYGITYKGDKPVVAARNADDQKFTMEEAFSMDTLEKFVEDLLAGNLKPYLKSEPIPEDSDEPVKVAVAENFDALVNDPTKDVLIEFYAPWCGHCKTLAPKYDELADMLSEETGITIVKMDATANDVPKQYQVSGFPTLYFAPKNSKMNPRKYEGGREINDFVKYLAKESTDPLSGYERSGKKKKTEL